METAFSGPVEQNKRIVVVDILRGWALLGVVLMNYTDIFFYLGSKPNPDAFNRFLIGFGNVVFSAKSWTMLSFLFGYGFAVLMNNVEAKGVKPVWFFSRRMFCLLVIAIINSSVWFGDILKDYAVLGMVLLLFRNVSAKTAFYTCVGLFIANPAITAFIVSFKINGIALAMPYFPLYQSHNLFDVFKSGIMATYEFEIANPFYLVAVHETMLICFLLGLAAQKINFFGRLQENKKYVKRVFWASLGFSVLMFALMAVLPWGLLKYYIPMFWLILSSMIFIMSAICWLYLSGKLRRFFSSMQAFGKMTLTNYVVQNILALLLFSGAGFALSLHHLSYAMFMLIALAIYIVQIYFSKWWLSKYQYGPLEWLWRQLSYGKRLAIKKVKASADN